MGLCGGIWRPVQVKSIAAIWPDLAFLVGAISGFDCVFSETLGHRRFHEGPANSFDLHFPLNDFSEALGETIF